MRCENEKCDKIASQGIWIKGKQNQYTKDRLCDACAQAKFRTLKKNTLKKNTLPGSFRRIVYFPLSADEIAAVAIPEETSESAKVPVYNWAKATNTRAVEAEKLALRHAQTLEAFWKE